MGLKTTLRRLAGRPRVDAGVSAGPPFKIALRRLLAEELAGVPAPRIAIVSDRPKSRLQRWIAELAPQATVVRFGRRFLDEDRRLHRELTIAGRFHLIVDETESGPRYARAPGLFFHLAPGGLLVLRRPRSGRGRQHGPGARADLDRLDELSGAVARALVMPGRPGPRASDTRRFALAVRRLSVTETGVELVSGVDAYVKVREEEADELLERRTDLGRVIHHRPAMTFRSRGSLVASASDRARDVRQEWQVPAVSLREYVDVVSSPGQVVARDGLLLPDTYRHNQVRRLRNRNVEELAVDFGRIRFPQAPPPGGPRRLEGAYFHLDNEVRGHFGHLMTEVVSRLWAWPLAQERHPGIRALLHTNVRRPDLLDYEIAVLAAAGIPRESLEFTHDPVVVETLIGATPMLSNPWYVHPDIAETWQRIGDNLARDTVAGGRPKRIFVSRRLAKRSCRNTPEVEALFAERGFTIVYPEDHPLGEQVRLFREARVVAGFAGSGLFNLMFAEDPKDVIVVASESYHAENEHLIAGVRGHRVRVAWCRSEAEWVDGAGHVRSEASMQAPYTFDFEREGRDVRSWIADLG